MTDVGGGCCLQSKHSKLGSVGFVSPTVQLRIADLETGKTLGANETGEIRLKVPSVMNGYYKNPEATKKCFDSDGKRFNRSFKIISDADAKIFEFNYENAHTIEN